MKDVTIRTGGDVPADALVGLYDRVGWTAYTRDREGLIRAIARSTWVATAWRGDSLLGLIRVISDDVAIAWLQDVLVVPEEQRTGIGRALAARALERFAHVRSFALMTDDEARQHAFYRSLGLQEIREAFGGVLHCFLRMK